MFRLVLLAVSMLGAASLTSSPAAAQRVQITPGNTCLMVTTCFPAARGAGCRFAPGRFHAP